MHLIPERTSLARWLALGLGAVGLATLVLVRLFPDLLRSLAHCPLRDHTGLPCPTCGGTHALIALAGGDVTDAVVANPLVVLAAVLFGLWFVWALAALVLPRLRVQVMLTVNEKRTARIGAALLLLGTWIWEIVRLC